MTAANHPCGFDADWTNVAAYLPHQAVLTPDKAAVWYPQSRDRLGRCAWTRLSYRELENLSNRYAVGLAAHGIDRGCRTLLMVRPSLDFIALAFALFKVGAVPILIDPGMGLSGLLTCIRDVEPEGLVALPAVMWGRQVFRSSFRSVRHAITVGPRPWFSAACTDDFARNASPVFQVARTQPDELAAILFTTGSTGPAKGVVYRHRNFEAQVQQLKEYYGIGPEEVEMPAFPLFALFSPALGITCVIPDMDPTRPAQVNPAHIVEAVQQFKVTNTFGSPSIWRRVSEYCVKENIRLPGLKRVLMAGAPVPLEVLARFPKILDGEGDTHTPYGATESLPTIDASGTEILRDDRVKTHLAGGGTFVGRPLPGMDMRIIAIDDDVLPQWSDVTELPAGEVGEIVVSGPVTTVEYFRKPAHNARAKIRDGNKIWHRMGDVGRLDEEGMLWFCGRLAHRIVTDDGPMFTIPCEAIFNQHPRVFRSALVGLGERPHQEPVIIIEPLAGSFPRNRREREMFTAELLELASAASHTQKIQRVIFHPAFPTDIRHNAKIFREKLTLWAPYADSLWKNLPLIRRIFFSF